MHPSNRPHSSNELLQQNKIKQVIEQVFEEFYLIVMKDHYMASFINSHQSMARLITSQTHFLYSALFEQKTTEIYQEYYKIGKMHWKIRLDESYLFKMLDFVEAQLIDKVRAKQLQLPFEFMEEVFHNIRNATGYAYIFGALDDAIYDLNPVSEEAQFQMNYLNSLRNQLLKIYNWTQLEIDYTADHFVNDFTLSPLGQTLSTIAFKIKSHTNRRQQLQIISLNKNIHKNAELALKYYQLGNYVQTYLMIKHLVTDTTLIIALLEQHNHHWQQNKNDILIRFLAEKSDQGGLFSLTSNASDCHGTQLNTTLFKQVTEHIKQELNTNQNVFAFHVKSTLYIYSEAQINDKFNLLKTLETISNQFIKQNQLKITSTLFNIGHIDIKYLQNLSFEEMRETIRVLSCKTEQLLSPTQQLINSIDFGPSILNIIDEIQQNLRLKQLVLETIEQQNVQLYFHPIVHIGSNQIYGAESLLRIKQNGQFVPVGDFIDIINGYNLFLQLDLAVINQLYIDLETISQKVNTLFININPESIHSDKAISELNKLIAAAAQFRLNIILELTEYSLTSELDRLKQLQAPNFGIAVDDFGTGYTNFEIVKNLKDAGLIQVLKVDGSLVKSITESETAGSLLETIILLGTKLGLDLVLEYIENQAIVDKLDTISHDLKVSGIVFGQGWYYSKPQPIESFQPTFSLANAKSGLNDNHTATHFET